MKNNSIIIKALILVITVIALGTTASYAYFQIAVSGNETTSTINIGGATLKLTYSNGSTLTGTNVLPGWSGTKNFQVKVETPKAVSYSVNLVVDSSNFYTSTDDVSSQGSSYLQYKLLSCTALGSGCSTTLLDTTTLAKTSGTIALKSESKSAGTFYYQLSVTFPNNTTKAQIQTGSDGKALSFKGHVTVTSSATVSA